MSVKDNSNTLSREELYKLVWSKPVSKILEVYPISNSAFKKVCKDNDVPIPENGYWQKLKYNKTVKIIPLTKSDKEYSKISLHGEKGTISELNILVKDIKKDNALPLKVPEELTKPDPLIITARKDIKNGKVLNNGDYKDFYSTSRDVFDIFVHKDLIKRALNFSNALIKLLKKRGHQIEVKSGECYNEKGTRLIIYGEAFRVCVRETRKRIKVKSEYSNYMTTDYINTGILTLRIEELRNHQWRDSANKKLEDKLPNILAYLEFRAKNEKIERARNEAWQKEYKLKLKIEEELKIKRNAEIDAFKSLINSSGRWYKSQNLRNYLDVFESKAIENKTLNKTKLEWLEWARQKADWYDPFIESEDETFKDLDRDNF